MKRRSKPDFACGFSSVSAVKMRRWIDWSAAARANMALAMWLALPSPSGSASTIFLPTRSMIASCGLICVLELSGAAAPHHVQRSQPGSGRKRSP